MAAETTKPRPLAFILLKSFVISLFILIPFLLLFLFLQNPTPTTLTTTTTTTTTSSSSSSSSSSQSIRIRPGYSSYENYIQKQLNKTLNPKLREIWTHRDWERKIKVFTKFFTDLKKSQFLNSKSKALCIGARVGQEVEALRRIGIQESIGIDLVPYPPLVIKGDFHHQPFDNNTFDFEFSNVFDHALYPHKFVGEIERTLKVGGYVVLHVTIKSRTDKYSANDLFSVDGLVGLFKRCKVVRIRSDIDGFGLDTEVVLQKKKS